MGLPVGFDPRPRPQWKKKVGLGKNIITKLLKVKEFAELTLAYELLAKDTSPVYQWTTFLSYILGDDGEGTTIVDEKHIQPVSIGAKIDLTTDEFWHLKGCKLNTLELRGNVLTNEPVTATCGILSQIASYGTTDYVSGDATRGAAPDTDYIYPSDCDLEIPAASSIYGKLSEWTLRINRNLIKRGRDDTTKTLFRSFEEGELEIELGIVMDFESKTELDDFMGATPRTATLELPSGVGGRAITLTNGYWRDMSIPKRELELIALNLTAQYTDISIGTT